MSKLYRALVVAFHVKRTIRYFRKEMLLIQASGISVGYGKTKVLSGVSARFEPGMVTALIGPNGSGKSTFLRSLAGALRPWDGSISVGGEDLYKLSARKAAALVAYVPQETAMPFAFTVGELVGLSGNGGKDQDSIPESIALMDLEKKIGSALNSLSGGEQQRTAIARGLAQDASCLLLDEPTAHLDLRHQLSLFQALRKRARASGTTVVVVLHDLAQAARYADHVVLLNWGQVEIAGTAQEVITSEHLKAVYGVAAEVHREGARIVAVAPADDLTFS